MQHAGALPYFDHGSAEFAADPHGSLRIARGVADRADPDGPRCPRLRRLQRRHRGLAFRPGCFETIRRASPAAGRAAAGSRRRLEGDDHQQLRRVVMPWSPPAASRLCARNRRAGRRSAAHHVTGDGGCELMDVVAMPIPPTVFCWMVGCDVERGPDCRHWSSIALQAFSGDPAVMPDVVAAIREPAVSPTS